LCSFRVCCTFLINRHCKTNIKSKKWKFLRNFDLHRERFDHFSIHDENRETIERKIVNSIDDSTRDFFLFHVVYQFNMWHRVKNVRYVQTQSNDHSIRFLFSYDVNLFDEKFQNRFNWSILSTFYERVE
jgi:hypothetical protein